MFSAVYYPHTAIRDEDFLKHGLLYWDEIEFVSPFHGYDVMPRYPQTVIRELAKFTKPRVPTEEEKSAPTTKSWLCLPTTCRHGLRSLGTQKATTTAATPCSVRNCCTKLGTSWRGGIW